jgi:hypothetical protein
MKTLNPREATLRDQFRQKLVDSSRNVFSEADLLQLAVELRLEQGFPDRFRNAILSGGSYRM